MMSKIRVTLTALALGLVSSSPPLQAGDGVIEINQAAVLAGGLSDSDAPGFPATLCSGSYRLTGDLVLDGGGVGLDVIEVACDHVSIDFNGFQVRGYALCSGNPIASCSNGAGPGRGVTATGPGGNWVSVRNGRISRMFGNGINLGKHARIEDMDIHNNGANGVTVLEGSRVERLKAWDNVARGVDARVFGDNTFIRVEADVVDSHIELNGGIGIETAGDVRNVKLIDNVKDSRIAFDPQVIARSVVDSYVFGVNRLGVVATMAKGNNVAGSTGIDVLIAENNIVGGTGTAIKCRVCRDNEIASGPGTTGIEVVDGSPAALVENNSVMAETCLDLQAGTLYRGNVLDCTGTDVVNGINAGGNYCGGSVCP